MSELDLDSFEISIESDIKGIKPKAKRRGYAKELVEKLHSTIEQALVNGCSYEQITEVLKLRKIKISASTLKRYHQANSKTKKINAQKLKGFENSQGTKDLENVIARSRANSSNSLNSSDRLSNYSQTKETPAPKNENQILVPDILSGSALTDDDYADDFNDY